MLFAGDVPEPVLESPVNALDYLLFIPAYYFGALEIYIRHAFAEPIVGLQSITFSTTLLAILSAHEAGHYFACRRYGVAASLPFFLPAPPPLLAGTFGAFIKIRSPIPTRRALFDIAVAGPLAGFVVIVIAACAAIMTAQPAVPLDVSTISSIATFNDPLLLRVLARVVNMNIANIAPNPFFFAAWIGLLVTALNLMPVGQLDGGHVTYAVFGATIHKWIARFAFVAMLVIAPLSFWWHGVPSGFLYAILLAVMLRVGHPSAMDEDEDLGTPRILLAFTTLAVFILSFLPFPLTIT